MRRDEIHKQNQVISYCGSLNGNLIANNQSSFTNLIHPEIRKQQFTMLNRPEQ
jgi:hypothetical protein